MPVHYRWLFTDILRTVKNVFSPILLFPKELRRCPCWYALKCAVHALLSKNKNVLLLSGTCREIPWQFTDHMYREKMRNILRCLWKRNGLAWESLLQRILLLTITHNLKLDHLHWDMNKILNSWGLHATWYYANVVHSPNNESSNWFY